MPNPAPEWVERLLRALDAEFGGRPRIAALATTDDDGGPTVRHVVIRNVEPGGAIWIASDGRSAKNAHLRRDPRAELSIWLPGRREQFRAAGRVELLGPASADTRRLGLWTVLSDSARGLFAWPPPGTPRLPDDPFPPSLPLGALPPDTFELLILHPESAECLDLNTLPHTRHRWAAEDGWERRLLNP